MQFEFMVAHLSSSIFRLYFFYFFGDVSFSEPMAEVRKQLVDHVGDHDCNECASEREVEVGVGENVENQQVEFMAQKEELLNPVLLILEEERQSFDALRVDSGP